MGARSRGRHRRIEEAVPERAGERADAPLAELQRAAGNRAVSGLVQRQATGPVPFSPFAPRAPSLSLPPTTALGEAPPRLTADAAAKVRGYLEGRRYEIGDRVGKGTVSMPEVVHDVREHVPEAVSAPVADIEKVVREVFGAIVPPPTRRRRSAEGASSELTARLANALNLPRLRVTLSRGSIELAVAGLVATTTVGGATVTATGTPSGGEVTAKHGSASVTVRAGADAFGLSATVERATFEAKVEKDEATGTWSKWELGLRIALVGDEPIEEMTDLPALNATVAKAEEALRAVIGHLRGGGSPTDARVKELLKDVKPAVEGVARAVDKPSGPRASVGATVKGGDEKLGTFAGLSLIVEF